MRQLTAISFLLILIFNLYGYRVVLSCLQTGSETALERRVDKKAYRDEELISIKTKLDLPYYTSSAEYERAYGSASIDGKDYEYVKRRVYHDTLELLCLPNPVKTGLKKADNDCANASAESPSSMPVKKGNVLLKIGLPDFCPTLPATADAQSMISRRSFYLRDTETGGRTCTRPHDRPPQAHPFLS